MSYLSEEYINKLFTYRHWSEVETEKFRPLREEARALAHKINALVPDSPQKTRAINALHEAVYLINTAVTVHHKEETS